MQESKQEVMEVVSLSNNCGKFTQCIKFILGFKFSHIQGDRIHLVALLAFFEKEDNFCDFLFTFLHIKPLKRWKEFVFIPFRVENFSEGDKNNFL